MSTIHHTRCILGVTISKCCWLPVCGMKLYTSWTIYKQQTLQWLSTNNSRPSSRSSPRIKEKIRAVSRSSDTPTDSSSHSTVSLLYQTDLAHFCTSSSHNTHTHTQQHEVSGKSPPGSATVTTMIAPSGWEGKTQRHRQSHGPLDWLLHSGRGLAVCVTQTL